MDNDKYIGQKMNDRYEIQEQIGTGGMANVYKALDTVEQKTVAVKILRDEFLNDSESLRRFKNETKAIALLHHPNIVQVYDVHLGENVQFMVMEYIEGTTLKDYIETQGVLPWQEAVQFTLPILQALQHAHEKGIIHRDIKPQNIMMLPDKTIKVTDFGIAQFARSESKTLTDCAIGSVHYISPEQAMGETTNEKSDLYSVGVMLFEMLTGKLPFEADTAVSVALHQIQTPVTRPTTLNPEIPVGLEEITLRAMQKDAGLRYPSAYAMIADLERVQQDAATRFGYQYGSKGSQPDKHAAKKSKEKEKKKKEGTKKSPYIPLLTGVTLAFVLASALFIFIMINFSNPFGSNEDIEVPQLVGIKYETALENYPDLTLEAEEGYSNEYAEGVIYEQDPEYGGTKIKENGTIRIKVSKGPQQVTLSDYTNQKADQVIQKLTEDGLVPQQQEEYSDQIESGYVIYTDPSAGTTLKTGETVVVYVSKGASKKSEKVPTSIIGMTLSEAEDYLASSTSFAIGNVTYESSSKPKGVILSVDPTGTQPAGTEINVVVSKGTEQTSQASQKSTSQASQQGNANQNKTGTNDDGGDTSY